MALRRRPHRANGATAPTAPGEWRYGADRTGLMALYGADRTGLMALYGVHCGAVRDGGIWVTLRAMLRVTACCSLNAPH